MADGRDPSSDGPAHGLELRDLTVRYYGRDDDALRSVSLEVAGGSLVALAGPNGAGKSTLTLAAAGMIPRVVRAKVDGSVLVDGDEQLSADDAPRGRHRVGIVFPNPANQLSATKATVREELAFGLENLGLRRAEMESRIEDVLARLRIGHLADRSPFALSGGEQQRVAIASIVAMGMSVVVLDEPTAQLDPIATAAVGNLLVEIAREGAAVLAAEHAASVLGLADRCAVLADGRIVAEEVPGQALGSERLASIGLRAPTLVRLAEAGGVPAERAFEEATVAAALEHRDQTAAELSTRLPEPAEIDWSPVLGGAPVTVELDRVIHRYPNGVEAVRGVSLGLAAGEAIAIVGQNGSGKTTLVKHLNGLLRPDSGEIRIDGRPTAGTPIHELARRIGFVFQNPDDQLFNRSVERELRFGPRNLRLPPADVERLVEQALDAIGLVADRTTNPYDLNVSSRKLVALGSVLAMDPAVLVLDEPTTGQDGPGVARVGAIVDGMIRAGRTVVAITHDMEFAARHFARIVVMRQGEVIADGPPATVFAPGSADVLASTGLTPPPAARIAARLGLSDVPLDAESLLWMLASRHPSPAAAAQ